VRSNYRLDEFEWFGRPYQKIAMSFAEDDRQLGTILQPESMKASPYSKAHGRRIPWSGI